MKLFCTMLFLAVTFYSSAQDKVEYLEHSKANKKAVESFKIYPNPAYGDIVYVSTKRNDTKDIIIYDVFGEVILKDRILNGVLNISKLAPGVYVLQVMENNKTLTRKLVVK